MCMYTAMYYYGLLFVDLQVECKFLDKRIITVTSLHSLYYSLLGCCPVIITSPNRWQHYYFNSVIHPLLLFQWKLSLSSNANLFLLFYHHLHSYEILTHPQESSFQYQVLGMKLPQYSPNNISIPLTVNSCIAPLIMTETDGQNCPLSVPWLIICVLSLELNNTNY